MAPSHCLHQYWLTSGDFIHNCMWRQDILLHTEHKEPGAPARWHCHKSFSQWQHSFHMKVVLPLAQMYVMASDQCPNTGPWDARILLLDAKTLSQRQYESCVPTGSKIDFQQHQITVAIQALRLQELCFYTQEFKRMAAQFSMESCAAIGSTAFDSMRSLYWQRLLVCKTLVSKHKIFSQ